MNDDAHIPKNDRADDSPEDDRDRRLAGRIADGLERGSAEAAEPSTDDAPFFEALLALKHRDSERRAHPSKEQSERVWAGVEEATRPRPERIVPENVPKNDPENIPATRRPGTMPPERGRTDRPARRRSDTRRTPAWVWMSAAAAVVLAGIVALLTLGGPDAELVAAAGAERTEYTTADGSVVTLRPYSNLYQVDASGSDVRYRIEGEAFFDVVERDEGTFAVEAGTALVEVLGTRFNLSTWGEGTAVFLEEGRIRFSHLTTGGAVTLDPGQSSRAAAGGVAAPVDEAPDVYLDWLSGAVAFEQRPARLVAAELEQHFDIDLDIPEAPGVETLSGRILLTDPASSLDDLGQVMGGRFVEAGPDVYRFVPE